MMFECVNILAFTRGTMPKGIKKKYEPREFQHRQMYYKQPIYVTFLH